MSRGLAYIRPNLQQRAKRDSHAQDQSGNGHTRLTEKPGGFAQQGIAAPILQKGMFLLHSMAFPKL